MSTTMEPIVTRLEDRASRAEKNILQLKEQLYTIKSRALEQSIMQERSRLEKENTKLTEEIRQLKERLNELETGTSSSLLSISLPNKEELSLKTLPPNLMNKNESERQPNVTKQKPEKEKNIKKVGNAPKSVENETVDVSRLDFRIGRIIQAAKHPEADSLYVEEVDIGEGKNRTVVSGLVNHVTVEELQNRLVVLLCNLKPAKMRGIVSEAMVMCASSPAKVEVLIPPEGSIPGDKIVFEKYPGIPETQLNPKKKIFEQIQPDLRTSSEKIAAYKGDPFIVPGKGIIVSSTLTDCPIK